jgi:hypothetical protein
LNQLQRVNSSKPHSCPQDAGGSAIAIFEYAAGLTVTVAADLGGCQAATNGMLGELGARKTFTSRV